MTNQVGKVVFQESEKHTFTVDNSRSFDFLMGAILTHPDYQKGTIFLINQNADGENVSYDGELARRPDGSIFIVYYDGGERKKIPGAKVFAQDGWCLKTDLDSGYVEEYKKLYDLFFSVSPRYGQKWKGVSLGVAVHSVEDVRPVVKVEYSKEGKITHLQLLNKENVLNVASLVSDGLKLSSPNDVCFYLLGEEEDLKYVDHDNALIESDSLVLFRKGIYYRNKGDKRKVFVTTPYCGRCLNVWDKVVIAQIDTKGTKSETIYSEVLAGNLTAI